MSKLRSEIARRDKMLKDIWCSLELYRFTAESMRDEYESKSPKSLEWRACVHEIEAIQGDFKSIVGSEWFNSMIRCLPEDK